MKSLRLDLQGVVHSAAEIKTDLDKLRVLAFFPVHISTEKKPLLWTRFFSDQRDGDQNERMEGRSRHNHAVSHWHGDRYCPRMTR